MFIQIEFCIVVQAQFFPFLEDEAVSVIAEEIQNIQVKQQLSRVDQFLANEQIAVETQVEVNSFFQNKANYQLEVFVFTNATPRMQTHDLKSKFMNSFEESITESGSGDITL